MPKSHALKRANKFALNRIWPVSILLILMLGASLASAVNAQAVITTISVCNKPVGNMLSAIAYDSGQGEIFVSNVAGNISVISDNTNSVIATVAEVGGDIYGMAYDSGKGELFVTKLHTNTVSVISDSSNTVVTNITVGNIPKGIAYDSGKNEVFVANSNLPSGTLRSVGGGTVSVISDDNNSVVATVDVGGNPFDLVYDSGKGEIFVADSYLGTISVISDADNSVVATVNLGKVPTAIVYDSDKGEIFVSDKTDAVSVISDTTNTVSATVTGASSLRTCGMAYDSAKGEIFVTNFDYNTVSVISDSTNVVVAMLNVENPSCAAYDSEKSEIFINNYSPGTVTVISDSIEFTATIPFIGDITIASDGSVNPSTAPIEQKGNSYTLTSDLTGSITIHKSFIVFNGNTHTIDGKASIEGEPFGIVLDGVSNVTVANTTITDTGNGILSMDETTAGIAIEYGDSNIITQNNIVNNYNGMSFLETQNNLIIENNITNNHNPGLGSGGCGIMFWGASNNTVYHNNFVGNPTQALDDSFNSPFSVNVWDNGYPAGGNYWGLQNGKEINGTGISDTSIVIDSQNKDRYPLIAPFTGTFMLKYEQEVTPPKITVFSPLNQNYNTSEVSLVFYVDKPLSWMGYSLDGQQIVTISGNTTLTNTTNGLHTLIVYGSDMFGYESVSQMVNFSIATSTLALNTEHFPITVVAAFGASVVVVVAGVLVYFKKHKR